MGCDDEKLSKYLTHTFMAHCHTMICQQVTLSGEAEWPKVADAVIEAHKAARKTENAGARLLQFHQSLAVFRAHLSDCGTLLRLRPTVPYAVCGRSDSVLRVILMEALTMPGEVKPTWQRSACGTSK